MGHENILSVMSQIPFFDVFTREEKEIISADEDYILGFKDKEHLIRQGETDFSVFIILQGKAIVTKNESPHSVISALESGAICGELSLLGQRPRSTNVIASGTVLALKLDGILLETLDPAIQNKLKDQLIQVLIQRIDLMNQSVIKLKNELKDVFQTGAKLYDALGKIIGEEEHVKDKFTAAIESGKQIKGGLENVIISIENLLREH